VEQVAFADRMLLNKTDLVEEKDLERVEARLKSLNQFAPIYRCCQSKVSVDNVLNIKGFDLKRTLEMDPEFLNTDGEHQHDDTVSSLSIIQKGDVDYDAVQDWVSWVLRTKATDIYRMKGVLAIAHAKQKFVYQAVHMIFNGTFQDDEVWGPDEERESKLVFIGKNLDKEALKSGFAKCATSPELEEEKKKKLRFAMGDAVECRTGSGWQKGKVVALMYRDEYMPEGVVAPYQVKLDKGDLIYAPADDNQLIRKAQ